MSIDEEALVLVNWSSDWSTFSAKSKKKESSSRWSMDRLLFEIKDYFTRLSRPKNWGNSVPFGTEIPLVLGAFTKQQHYQEPPFSHVKKFRHHCAQGTAFYSAPSRLKGKGAIYGMAWSSGKVFGKVIRWPHGTVFFFVGKDDQSEEQLLNIL